MDAHALLTLGVALFWALTAFAVLLIVHAILKRKSNDIRRGDRVRRSTRRPRQQ